MRNTNCLRHMRCPKCRSLGPFDIVNTCLATVTDDGIEDAREHEWDDESKCYCCSCDMRGTVADFKTKPKKA